MVRVGVRVRVRVRIGVRIRVPIRVRIRMGVRIRIGTIGAITTTTAGRVVEWVDHCWREIIVAQCHLNRSVGDER